VPGRNDPCPCGSGRKYKQCCLNAREGADFLWWRIRAAEGRLVPELLELSLRECGPDLLNAGLDEFFLWNGVPDAYEETDEFASFFVPWFVYEFVDDPADPDRVLHAPTEALASLYLRRHADRLSGTERAFLEAAATSPLCFYAVTHAQAGRELALRDILSGADLVVREQNASRTVQPGDLLFTRILTVQGTSIMSGAAPLAIPPEWHLSILDVRDRLAGGPGRTLTRDAVRDFDLELRELYFFIEDQIWNPRLPEIRNTDGDRLVLTTLTYALRCPPAKAFDRLKSLARASKPEAAQLVADAVLDENGEIHGVTIPWIKRRTARLPEDTTTLGTIEIDGDQMRVEVNSTRRASRIVREIAKRLGPDAELESRQADSIETLLARREETPRDRIAELEQARLQEQPEVQEFLRQRAERYWEDWLDTPIPALGQGTPRQAASTPEGRERLEALFMEFARRRGRSPDAMAPDVDALRASLGLS
jgi:hypothetical protein